MKFGLTSYIICCWGCDVCWGQTARDMTCARTRIHSQLTTRTRHTHSHFVFLVAVERNATPSKHHVFHFRRHRQCSNVCDEHTRTVHGSWSWSWWWNVVQCAHAIHYVDIVCSCAEPLSCYVPVSPSSCHTKIAFCFLFHSQFRFFLFVLVLFFICFVSVAAAAAERRQLWAGVDNHFSEYSFTQSHTHTQHPQDLLLPPQIFENYYCFCLCRKIRPTPETIAFYDAFIHSFHFRTGT